MTVLEGVVLGRRGAVFRVLAGDRIFEASIRGRIKYTRDESRVIAGDRVALEPHEDGTGVIAEVFERRSVLSRRAGDDRRATPVAANVDRVVIVAAAKDPEPVPRMLDRLAVVAEVNELPVLFVVNKLDLGGDWPTRLEQRYAPAQYPVRRVSATTGQGIDELRVELERAVSVFTGPTGVGKSSLLNAIEPGLGLRTREISKYWRTGRHTTVAAELVAMSGGGFVVDTPGLREVALWNVEPAEVAQCFPEIREHMEGCRFADCRHLREPGCAVRAAADEGTFDGDRLATYERLLEEAEQAVRHWE